MGFAIERSVGRNVTLNSICKIIKLAFMSNLWVKNVILSTWVFVVDIASPAYWDSGSVQWMEFLAWDHQILCSNYDHASVSTPYYWLRQYTLFGSRVIAQKTKSRTVRRWWVKCSLYTLSRTGLSLLSACITKGKSSISGLVSAILEPNSFIWWVEPAPGLLWVADKFDAVAPKKWT